MNDEVAEDSELPNQANTTTSISLTNGSAGYNLPSASGGGGGSWFTSGSISAMPNTISLSSGAGGGGVYTATGSYTTSSITGMAAMSSASGIVSIMSCKVDDSDITVKRPDGTTLAVAKSIETILEHLQLIVPNDNELRDNPALNLAYENYLEMLATTRNPGLKEAFDSYHTVRNLVKDTYD